MRQQLYLSAFVVVASAFGASTASADTYSDCEVAVANGEIATVERLASQILGFNFVPAHKSQSAEICVSAAKGEPMVYSDDARTFISPVAAEALQAEKAAAQQEAEFAAQQEAEARRQEVEAVRKRICELRDVVAETQETIRQAEAAQKDRRIETLSATIQECSIWFKDDARGALTNDVCNSIFASGGLPNSEVSGPTTSEVLMAEIINTNAETELALLVESGMLLSTIAPKALGMGLLDGDDPYNCRQ